MKMSGPTSQRHSAQHTSPRPRSVALITLVLGVLASLLQGAELPATSPSVVLATKLSGYAQAVADSVTKLNPGNLTAADQECKQAAELPSEEEVATCRVMVAAAWTEAAMTTISAMLEEQATAIRETKASDGAALGRLSPAVANRPRVIRDGVAATATELVAKLAKPTSGMLQNWLTEVTLAEIPQQLAASAKKAAERADAAVLEALLPKPPTDADLLAELDKTREKLLSASEAAYSRSVTCSWNADGTPGKRLTCSPGLLLSGEEISDVFIEGLPRGKKVEVTALITEQRVVLSQRKKPSKVATKQLIDKYGSQAGQRLDIDSRTIEVMDNMPVVIEIHTHRFLKPSHGGGICVFHCAGYWAEVASVLRDPSSKRLTLVSKGAASRLFVTVRETDDDRPDIAAISLGYARWKFEASGFLGGSSVVDHEVRSRNVPGANRVIVEQIAPTDRYSIETGALVSFIPQNYQGIGFALGFAMNEGRFPSTYLGVNFRVRTFGQKGLASLGAGYLLKSVIRFPGLEEALDNSDRGIAAESELLRGKNQFRDGPAVLISLGFSFGPISGAREASQ